MTLNSTGLGIGRSPSYRFQASSGTKATTASIATVGGITTTDSDDFGIFFRLKTDATGANRYAAIASFDNGGGNGARDLVLQDLGGNVGIGASPTDRLTVWGGSTTNGDARFNVGLNDNTSAALGTGAGLYLAGYTNGIAGAAIFASIKGIKENGTAGNTAGALVFTTLPNGGSNVERMRIDSAGNPIFQPSATPATLGTNGMLTVNATSNTNLRFSYRGSDGTTRVANITLA
jgi:hypothetical protein